MPNKPNNAQILAPNFNNSKSDIRFNLVVEKFQQGAHVFITIDGKNSGWPDSLKLAIAVEGNESALNDLMPGDRIQFIQFEDSDSNYERLVPYSGDELPAILIKSFKYIKSDVVSMQQWRLMS